MIKRSLTIDVLAVVLLMIVSLTWCAKAQNWPTIGTYTAPSGSAAANGEHPRLHFTDSTFDADIAPYINTYESVLYQELVDSLDGDLGQTLTGLSKPELLWKAQNYCFLAYVTSNNKLNTYTYDTTAAGYVNEAKNYFTEIKARVEAGQLTEFRAGITGSQGGYINSTVALYYDLVYDSLSLSEKQDVADLFQTMYLSEVNDRCFPGEGINQANDFNSQCWEVGLFGGLVMYGEKSVLGASYHGIIDTLTWVHKWFTEDAILKLDSVAFRQTFGNQEGTRYRGTTFTHKMHQMPMVASAIDTNLYTRYPYYQDAPLHFWFTHQPGIWDDGTERGFVDIRWGDAWIPLAYDPAVGTNQSLQGVVAHVVHQIKRRDPQRAGLYRWLLEDSRIGQGSSADAFDGVTEWWAYWLYYKLIWGYKDVTKVSIADYGLEMAQNFGYRTIIHTDFTDTLAAQVTVNDQLWHVNGHKHTNMGAVGLYTHGGNIVVETAGNWKSSSAWGGSYPEPESTNPLSVNFQNVMGLENGTSSFQMVHGSNPDADSYDNADMEAGGDNELGTSDFRHVDSVFTHVRYDYTRSFKGNSPAVSYARRDVTTIRGAGSPSDSVFVVVVDAVIASASSYDRHQLWNTVYQPSIVGQSWDSLSVFHYSFGNSDNVIQVDNTYGQADARGFLRFFALGGTDSLQWRGGGSDNNGRWFVDAAGGSLHAGGDYGEAQQQFVGAYRLECINDAVSDTTYSIAVWQLGSATTMTTMAAVDTIPGDSVSTTNGDYLGVRMFYNSGKVKHQVFVPKATTLQPGVDFKVAEHTDPSNTLHIISGLLDGTYELFRNDRFVTFVAVENTTGYFRSPHGGNWRLIKQGSREAVADGRVH